MDAGAITFLDVLGWKGIWTRDQEAIAKLRGLIAAALDSIRRTLHIGAEHLADLRGVDERHIQIESISDTIVIFTPGAATATLWLHGALCQVIVCESMDRRIPVRGATCYGAYESREHIMVGPGIDEAASWHESTDWIGVIQTPSAYLLYSEPAHVPRVWVPYAPPLKLGRVDTLCVDWSRHWREVLGRDEAGLKNLFAEMGPLDTTIASKYLNALAFYRKQNSSAEGRHDNP